MSEPAASFNYERSEIDRALDGTPENHRLSLKITGDESATRWLSVTPAQVRAVRALLTGGPGPFEALDKVTVETLDDETKTMTVRSYTPRTVYTCEAYIEPHAISTTVNGSWASTVDLPTGLAPEARDTIAAGVLSAVDAALKCAAHTTREEPA